MVLLLLRVCWLAFTPLQPAAGDPVLQLEAAGGPLELTLRGILLSDPVPSGAGCRALLQLPVGRTELRFEDCPKLQQSWRLQVQGRLRRPQVSPHPLLAAPAERLARQGSFSQLQVQDFEVLQRTATPVADLRRSMALALVQHAGPDNGSVLAALVLGSAVVPVPAELREAFRAAGLSHALAASGFHLSVLLGVMLPLGAGLPRLGRLSLAAAAMLLFVLLAGPQPSVLRAALMGALALGVLECGYRGRPLGILAASALALLLARPEWLLDVGFQLSVVATAALVVSARPLELGLRRWLPGWLAVATAVPLAASLYTLPLQLLHFGVVPLYAVPANLVVAPLLTPLTLGAMALACLAVILPQLLTLATVPFAWLSSVLVGVVKVFGALPMAQWQLGRPAPGLVLLFTVALLVLAWPSLARRWRMLGGALFALVVAVQFSLLSADQLLLVHQGRLDLLVARHQGRGVLVSSSGDGFSCSQASQLARGLGVQRYDWALLLDPVAPEQPNCWQGQAGLVMASADGSLPFHPGQRLASPGLSAAPVAIESRAIQLQLGRWRWLLLPDRQALWAWWQLAADGRDPSRLGGSIDGVWLGFVPSVRERRQLQVIGAKRLWLSGAIPPGWPSSWAASGPSGYLQATLG
ncbi:MAG: ComEC/Rec2 family competence protein [Cyanobacteria bacterium]|nr:ComEC/Rec2 family competence protein [Cyanobacteriota bacterium]